MIYFQIHLLSGSDIVFLMNLVTCWFLALLLQAAPASARDDAVQALKKAAMFYQTRVASHGGYTYYYSEDLKQRWGEGKFGPETIFVEPPGTPRDSLGRLYICSVAAI